jgi:hypothetical protein
VFAILFAGPEFARAGTIYHFAGSTNGAAGYTGDGGPAAGATLYSPQSLAIDRAGNLFIADLGNSVVRRVDAATGVITTYAGNGTFDFSGDGGPATNASLNLPFGLAFDSYDNLYISDFNFRIRRVDAVTGIITTVAGNGIPSYSGDGGPATNASIYNEGLAVDGVDNLYIADSGSQTIRKLNAVTRIISRIAGFPSNVGSTGDGGPATNATFLSVTRVAVDSAGNVFVVDSRAGGYFVRRIDATTGLINRFAGGGTNTTYSGPATNAYFNEIHEIDVTGGQLYISADSRVFQVDLASGEMQVLAGTGVAGNSGDGGPATQAMLTIPYGVGVSPNGDIFVADADFPNRVRRIERPTSEMFTVVNTNDSGPGSLREVITQANARSGGIPLEIRFAIETNLPAEFVHTIRPLSPLPPFTRSILIRGNIGPVIAGTPLIELDGSLAGPLACGLDLQAAGCAVFSLAINRFSQEGILINGADASITGNRIGTDAWGQVPLGNAGYGIVVNAARATVGGAVSGVGNIVSGNQKGGILLQADANTVRGNLIGTDIGGNFNFGNGGDGITISNSSFNQIGGNVISGNGGFGLRFVGNLTASEFVAGNLIGTTRNGTNPLGNGAGGVAVFDARAIRMGETNLNNIPSNTLANTIAFNNGPGVVVNGSASGVSIIGNAIHSNAGLGIDLGGDGITPNDSGDVDTGPNGRQNFADITFLGSLSPGNSVSAAFHLDGKASTTYRFDFYASATCDPSGAGEGARLVGSQIRTTSAGSGQLTSTQQLAAIVQSETVSLTVTEFITGNTSEFSACKGVTTYFYVSAVDADAPAPLSGGIPDGSSNTLLLSENLSANLLPLVNISVTDSVTTNASTQTSGLLAMPLPVPGTYTFTPSRLHYTFTPASISLTNPLNPSVFVTFTGRVDRFPISGTVHDSLGTALPGVRVSLNPTTIFLEAGPNGRPRILSPSPIPETITDALGRYQFLDILAGKGYQVRPAKAGYLFAPPSAFISDLSAPETKNFTGTFTNRILHARVVRPNTVGVPNITVVLNSPGFAPRSAITDANGNVTFTGLLPNPGHQVSLSSVDVSSSPGSQTVSLVDGDGSVEFIAERSIKISGRIRAATGVDPATIGAVVLYFDDQGTGTNIASTFTVVGSAFLQGNYVSPPLHEFRDYTVRPVSPGLQFTPATQGIDARNLDLINVDFTVSPTPVNIVGRLTNSSGFPLTGAKVLLSGGGTVLTQQVNIAGRYAFNNVRTGLTYAVSVSRTNFQFTPISTLLQNVSVTRTQDFKGMPILPLSGRIIFTPGYSAADLTVMNADGSSPVTVPAVFPNEPPDNTQSPALSPDGTKVAYVQRRRSDNTRYPVVVQNVDGSAALLLTGLDENAGYPTWSPDGTRVAVRVGSSSSRREGIYLINVDGSGAVRVPGSGYGHHLNWSPNGENLTYDYDLVGGPVVWIPIEGASLPTEIGFGGYYPVWSPDNSKIGFLHEQNAFTINHPNSDHLSQKTFFAFPEFPKSLSWSPDGAFLAFHNHAGQQPDKINVMTSYGGTITPIADGIFPSWGPSPGLATAIGTNVTVSNGIAAVIFSNVTASGTTTVIPTPAPSSSDMPSGYVSISGGPTLMNFEVTTTASNSGPITLCFTLTNITNSATFDSLRILHNENGTLVDRTLLSPDPQAPNFAARKICARVNSLSPFSIARLIDNSLAMITGVVVDTQGSPLDNVALTLDDNLTPAARTDGAGAFNLPNLAIGVAHIVMPRDSRFDFNPPVGVVIASAGLNPLIFVATPKAPPVLSIAADRVNAGLFQLTWPVSDDYDVEFTDSLATPEWTALGAQLGFANGNNVVLVQSGAAARFFRLKKL